MAEIFNNIGETHLGLNQLDEAQQNLEEGVRVQNREPKSAKQHLASLYYNMGKVAYARHDYNEAKTNFDKSNQLLSNKKKTTFLYDPLEKRLLNADLLLAMGYLESARNPEGSEQATKKFTGALKIYESTLPSTHPKVAETHINIFCEYVYKNKFQSAIAYQKDHLEPLLKDYEDKQITTQQELANLYAIIGACFVQENKFDDAMKMWKKGILHEQKTFLDQHLSSARVSKIKLDTRLVQNAYRTALDHYKKNNNSDHSAYLGILYAKMHNYDQATNFLQKQNSIDLANRLILQRNFQQNMDVYQEILRLKKDDITLRIGILLQMFTAGTIPNEYPIQELNKLDEQLTERSNDTGNRLRMIIKDCLAKNYLLRGNYPHARVYSDDSFELKQRHFSSHHPSLARNHLLTASCALEQEDYKSAAEYYEKAIEIQCNNSLSNNGNIRSTYFLMGDCYCKMGKIELANENYERAQESDQNDADDDEEPEQDFKALIRMHSNLANGYAKQKEFVLARLHEEDKIEIVKEILPKFIVKLIEKKNASSVTFEDLTTALESRLGLANRTKFAQVLQNFVFIKYSLGRALLLADESTEDDKDPTDLYEEAIELELKLRMFEKDEKSRLLKLYEELSNAYKKLYHYVSELILENLANILDGTTNVNHKRSLEFRLGNLHFDEGNFFEADRFWKRALKNVLPTQTTVKTIIEELIKKNEKNISRGDDKESDKENEDNTDQLSQHSETPSQPQSVKSQRRQS
ncbi:unnamed protein product, partial [Rotaria sordida]